MSKQTEIWKDVRGYEGVYQVSNLGNVKRIGAIPGAVVGRLLKPFLRGGYPFVVLSRNNVQKNLLIHRLVCEAFNGPPPSQKHEVNHKNGNRIDSRASNLEWVTRSENHKHAYRVLDRKPPKSTGKGESHNTSKLTAKQVRRIRRLYAAGKYNQSELARQYGLHTTTIWAIVHRKSWTHID